MICKVLDGMWAAFVIALAIFHGFEGHASRLIGLAFMVGFFTLIRYHRRVQCLLKLINEMSQNKNLQLTHVELHDDGRCDMTFDAMATPPARRDPKTGKFAKRA